MVTWRWDRPAAQYIFLREDFDIGGIAENDPPSEPATVSVVLDRQELSGRDGAGIGPLSNVGKKTEPTRAVIAFHQRLTWEWYLPSIDRPPPGRLRLQQLVKHWRYRVTPVGGTERAFLATNGDSIDLEVRVRSTQKILGYGSVGLTAAGAGVGLVVGHPIILAGAAAGAVAGGLFKAARWARSKAMGTGSSIGHIYSEFDDLVNVLERVDRLQDAVEAAEAAKTDGDVESTRNAILETIDTLKASGQKAVDRAVAAMRELIPVTVEHARKWRSGVPISIQSQWQTAGLDVAYLKKYVESGDAANAMADFMPVEALADVGNILAPTLQAILPELNDAIRLGARRFSEPYGLKH